MQKESAGSSGGKGYQQYEFGKDARFLGSSSRHTRASPLPSRPLKIAWVLTDIILVQELRSLGLGLVFEIKTSLETVISCPR